MQYREKLRELGIYLDKSGKQTCPKCSETRKNKTDKCLSVTYDNEAVLYKCHHCDWAGAVFYRDKFETKKVYQKPKQAKERDNQKPLYDYFAKRKISQETLKKYDVVYSDNKEIVFKYYKNGELVNNKYRTNLGNGKKSFRQEKDTEKTFYGMDIVPKDSKELIIVEGECFRGDTEILTPEGWIRLDKYNGQMVMQVDNLLQGNFVKPIAYINKYYEGHILEHKTKNGTLRATENHNIFYKNRKNEFFKKKFLDVPKGAIIPTSIDFDGEINIEENLLRLLVAIQADGSLDYRKNGNIHIRFTIKKQRKAERIEKILKALNKKYSKSIDSRGYFYFGFIENKAFKNYPKEWYNLSKTSRNILLDEILYWDGNSVPNRNQIEYATKTIENAVFIQTMAHLSNYSSTIIPRKNKYGEWFKVSILFKKNSYTICKKPKFEQYNDMVYCVQVPTGLILTRTDNKITVTGNCDVLSFAEQGILNVVSIPQGASENKLECIENCYDFISKFETYILAVDNDDAGDKLKNTLLCRLGKEKCKVVNWKQYKDANEALIAEEKLQDFLSNATEINPDGIITFVDGFDEIYKYNFEADKDFYYTGWSKLDKFLKIRTGHLMIVSGYPSRGKTTFTDNLIVNLTKKYGMKHLIASFESTMASHYNTLFEMFEEKPIRFNKEELFNETYTMISEHFYRFDISRIWNIDEICERTELAVKKYGIKTLTIDPYNRLNNKIGDREDKYIGSILAKLCMLAKRLDILIIFVAHPKKPDGEKVPNMYSISGSGDWYNMADYGIIVHRDRATNGELLNTPKIIIEKIKNFTLGNPSGGVVELRYNLNKRILED